MPLALHFPGFLLAVIELFFSTHHMNETLFLLQGNVWKKAEVTITSRTNYQMIFEGVNGRDYRSDIAIDDITFRDGYCVGLCSSVNPQRRVDCGYLGITKAQCVGLRRCCWDDSVPNVPYCFYHPSACKSVIPANR